MGEFFVYSFFFGILFFLFPIFVYVDAYVDVKENRCWFSLSFFKYLKVFSGYMQLHPDGLIFHLTKKTAIILPYKQMMGMRKKFEITNGFQLYRFHQIVEAGSPDKISGIVLGAILHSISGQVFSVMQTNHPFLSLRHSTLLSGSGEIKITINTAFVFNGLILSIAFTKKLLEAIINWIRKKRSTASWKKQHSS